jgi:hypothetical protein
MAHRATPNVDVEPSSTRVAWARRTTGRAFRGARPRNEVEAINQAVIGVALLLCLLVVLVLAIKTT